MGDLAALQSDIARDVSQKLRTRLTGAEEKPHETLTAQLQRELRARTYPDLHPLIARLSVWQDGAMLTLGCARATEG